MYKIESKASKPQNVSNLSHWAMLLQRLRDSEIELIYFDEFMLTGRRLNYKGWGK